MGKLGKPTPEETVARRRRQREFQELLEKRAELDKKLAAERGRRGETGADRH